MNFDDAIVARVGQGWDLHRLTDGGPLRLGGVDVPFDRGASGHSDGDVVLHAVTDAVLGAIAAGDIGTHFPDSDPALRGADSGQFLEAAVGMARDRGFRVGQIDVTVILERPMLAPHRDAICRRLAALLEIGTDAVSLKAKTAEGLGAIGRGEAVAALALAALVRQRAARAS